MKIITLLLLGIVTFGGCLSPETDLYDDCWQDIRASDSGAPVKQPTAHHFGANTVHEYVDMGFDGTQWPQLDGAEITILDHGAFDYAFKPAKARFEALTGATVKHVAADDAGTALQLAAQDQQAGGASFDVIYGIDNVLMQRASDAAIFAPYTPLLGDTVDVAYRFVPTVGGAWLATPVDMGFIAINVDGTTDLAIGTLDDLVAHAGDFVTEDPRFSSVGLGFLMSTIATYGKECYLGYWEDLFDGNVTVTSGWTEAYAERFSGGYGQYEVGTRLDKHIVTSYTTSPAYEAFYGADPATLNRVVTASQSTFQQIQTMGILEGTKNRAAAEAWIEFSLTDGFQNLSAEYNAIYPVVDRPELRSATAAIFGALDPQPGTFQPASLSSARLGTNVDVWVAEWVDLYDAKRV